MCKLWFDVEGSHVGFLRLFKRGCFRSCFLKFVCQGGFESYISMSQNLIGIKSLNCKFLCHLRSEFGKALISLKNPSLGVMKPEIVGYSREIRDNGANEAANSPSKSGSLNYALVIVD